MRSASTTPLILYSSSPRRAELLNRIGITCETFPVDSDESILPNLSSPEVVSIIAERKLKIGVEQHSEGYSRWGLAADTLVEGKSGLLGKPDSREDAATMLWDLSGTSHLVHSAVCVHAPLLGNHTGIIQSEVHSTQVFFRSLSAEDIINYLNTNEWKGVAGAYRIQGFGAVLVERIEGLWSTVVGLPLSPLYGILTAMSFPFG